MFISTYYVVDIMWVAGNKDENDRVPLRGKHVTQELWEKCNVLSRCRVCAFSLQVPKRDRARAGLDFQEWVVIKQKMGRRGRHKDYYVKRQKGPFKHPWDQGWEMGWNDPAGLYCLFITGSSAMSLVSGTQ